MVLDEPGDGQEAPAAPFALCLSGPGFGDVVIEVHQPTSGLLEDQVVLTGAGRPYGATHPRRGDVVHRRLREPSLAEQRDGRGALATAHVETLMQAAMHFGLAVAVGAVGFDSAAASWGVWLLVIGSAMQATGVTSNWITKTTDQFAQRSPAFVVNSLSTFIIWPGLLITGYGILNNL